LDGKPFSGQFSARRLRKFIPKEGTELAKAQKEVMAKAREVEQQMVEEERQEVERLRKEDCKAANEWLAEEYLHGTEGEGNGYVEGATIEGAGWGSEDGEEFGDLPLADKSATFFYQDGEREHVEKDVGIAGCVKERRGEGGHKAARTPPF
jgi:hypothetical protein